MVFRPENREQEAEEKHHQAKANQADDCKGTQTECRHIKQLLRRGKLLHDF